MFCSRCGHENIDGAAFCQHCGTPMAAPQPTVYTQPPVSAYPPAPQPTGHPVIETVRSLILSPLSLTAMIAFTASILFSLLGSFCLTDVMGNYMTDFLYEFGMNAEMDQYIQSMMMDSMGVSTVIGALFGSIPSVLMALGMWMLYTSARNRQNLFIGTGGLTLIKVLTIISLVSLCGLSALLMLLLVVVWVAAASEMIADEVAILSVVMVIVLAILAIALAVCILYYAKIIKTVGTIQKTLQTGVPSDRVSMFLIVMCFISGGSSALSSFSLLLLLAFGGGALLVATLAQAASYILFGLLLLQYRSRMRELMAWAPPVPAAAPYVAAQHYYGVPMKPAPPTDEIPTQSEME